MRYYPLSAPSEEVWFRVWGNFFGYPSCCVEAFLHNWCHETKDHYPEAPWMGTGYIPCLSCAQKALPDFQAFVDAELAPHRKFWKPFPQDE